MDSVVREINKINERELELGVKGSWHDEYKGMSSQSLIRHCLLPRFGICFRRGISIRFIRGRCGNDNVTVRLSSSS